jgi:hypothetical protein
MAAAYEILGDPDRRAAYDRGSPVVRVVVRRQAPYGPPPVRLGPRRLAASQHHLAVRSTRAEAWPPLLSTRLAVDAAGWHFGSPTHTEDELLQLATEMLRRLRLGRF